MQVSRAAAIWLEYHKSHSRKSTLKSYEAAMGTFLADFAHRQIGEISTGDILSFLNRLTEGKKPQTRRVRYAHLSAFFNFIRNHLDPEFRNPCDTPAMKRLFRNRTPARWDTLDKDTVDEVIFKTVKIRDRLMLELMARGGMRVGEVLKLTANDVNERKLTLREPKSGRVQETVFIPQKVADRLKDYLKEKSFEPDDKIFPICYEAARAVVKRAGNTIGVKLRPHDLRRHAATHASRSGVPVEIVSKVILRHTNLSRTQRYLGKVTDTEAIRWIDNLYS